jgi:hypothetical protein
MEQVEVRARQLSGRHQISATGFHLVDGVPFGTRPLRPLSRPSVVIPPRKRRRISTDESSSQQGIIEPGVQLSIANVDDDEQQLALLNSGNASLKEGDIAVGNISPEERQRKRARTNKNVHFESDIMSTAVTVVELSDDGEDDEDDEDFEDMSEDASSSDSSSEDSSNESSDSQSGASSPNDPPSEESLHRDTWEGLSNTREEPAPTRAVDSAPPYQVCNRL